MSNWPFGTDLSGSNWTGRTDRHRRVYSRYTRADEKIPVMAWVVGLTLLAAVFGLVPLLSWVMQ
jgi:hypothetical protein